ncbi:MAG: hypothetical protein KAS07_05920, partial [Candidatus Pacebacteria bacterium]|nr:hypothetical protein [Candidatus Paceibacterota bacterium]
AIEGKLVQFDDASAWGSGTYYPKHTFVIQTARLFECRVAHDSEGTFSIPITGTFQAHYWTEHTTVDINFEIKGATNLDDLPDPLVIDDVVYAIYNGSQWNSIQTLYPGGVAIQYAEITQTLTHASEDEYEVELIDSSGTLSGSPIVIDRALGYDGMDSDNTDIRNWVPWYGVGARVPVSQHYDDTAAALKWFIDTAMLFIGAAVDRSIDVDESDDNLRIMGVWK